MTSCSRKGWTRSALAGSSPCTRRCSTAIGGSSNDVEASYTTIVDTFEIIDRLMCAD
ncbi:hypothetical protein WME97_40310 [Sorangium sp. So ce367]|uniref:hypothetical protein n=1 Tax=Sorangium sp. So ce367 TaxID=3133305 RepID=UPI003F637FF0